MTSENSETIQLLRKDDSDDADNDNDRCFTEEETDTTRFATISGVSGTAEEQVHYSNVNKCGFCGFAPNWCQVFNSTQWSLFFLGLAAFIQGAIVNGMIHFFISTIERRYEMPSYQSGLMSGAFDMASMMFLIPVTYLGGRITAHKPRWIATGTLIVAIGSFVFSSPHFIAGRYKSRDFIDLCIQNRDINFFLSREAFKRWTFIKCDDNDSNGSSFSKYFWILFLGNFLHGAGGTPLFTLCIAFIDESVPREKSSLYLGLYYFLALLGPSVGYGLGGLFIRLYVDFPEVKNSDLEICPNSPTWVGCWWIGFIICGFVAFIISGIIFCMPKELKGSKKLKVKKSDKPVPYQTLRELPIAFGTLLSNFVYMCVVAVACCEGLLVSGFGAFMPKILEKEFNLSSEMVAIVMGLVALPSALLGLVLGGWLVNYFHLGLKATLRLDILLFILATFCIPAILIGCPNDTLVGINHPYFDEVKSKSASQNYSLWSKCNSDCGCTQEVFSPVCGKDNMQYFSACFAGCKRSEMETVSNYKIYYDCQCIPPQSAIMNPSTLSKPEATSMPCKTDCPLFPLFLVTFFLYQLFTFTAAVPAISVMLRTVNVNLKSLALGLQWILSRLMGTIPGPVIFGAIMDHNCLFWYSPHSISKGVCLLYHHFAFRVQLALVAFIWKIAQVFFFGLALFFLRKYPPPPEELEDGEESF